MKNLPSLGIIGAGFVGSAVARGFTLYADIKTYDRDERKRSHTFEEVVNCDFVFISLPTPMETIEGGACDLSIIEDFFNNAYLCNPNSESIFIIKSTVPVGTTERLAKEYPSLRIVHNPEFLTARAALIDFITPARNIVGGSNIDAVEKVAHLFENRFPGVSCLRMSSNESEFVKYMANTFFATKVTFFNEMRLFADKKNMNWDNLIAGVLSDGRIGVSHYQVPGHDGDKGWGGSCFPKDINALISLFESEGIDPKLLKASWEQNLAVRKNWDWANNPSAVSKKEN